MAMLEVTLVVRVFHSHSPAELELCWDDKTWLKPGEVVEVLEVIFTAGNVAIKIQRDGDDGPTYLTFEELSGENQRNIREFFPDSRSLFWLQ